MRFVTRGHHRFFSRFLLVLVLVGGWLPSAVWGDPVSSPDQNHFSEQIAPLLARRCLGCHNASEKKGGLDLTSLKGLQAKGDSEEDVLTPGKPDKSLLWERVESDEMPPKKPLTAEEKQLLKDWIAAGAKWDQPAIDLFKYTSDSRAGYDWWAWQPLVKPEPPALQKSKEIEAHPIDAFVLAKLEANGLTMSPPASKRTLIRRLSFDLRGLPPAPAEIDAFLKDESPHAYEKLVDRYLDSPAYGERWARHWLDIVRFGESQGFERDRLRPNSWRYRDWVVRAFNRDLPYDEFVRQQVAGDVIEPHDPEGVIATGFLVAGAWDEVGQSQQSKAMRAVVRQDELEDLIGTTAQTFLGLTVHCARCHDHKFDPIRQSEYYQFSAALGGVRHGERESLVTSERERVAPRLAEIAKKLTEKQTELDAIEFPVRARLAEMRKTSPAPPVPKPIARWDFNDSLKDSIGELHGEAHGAAKLAGGRLQLDGKTAYVSTAPLQKPLTARTLEAWVAITDLNQRGGGVISVQSRDGNVFDAIVFGEREPSKWVPGSNGFVRTQDVGGIAETIAAPQLVQLAIVYDSDGTITAYRNGLSYGKPYKSSGVVTFVAENSQVLFGLRHGAPGGNRLLAAAIDRAQLYDRALTAAELAASAGVSIAPEISEDDILAGLDFEARSRRQQLVRIISQLESEQRLLSGGPTYAVVPREPERTHLLDRGNTAAPREVVSPGGVAIVATEAADFKLSPDAPEAERRRYLANWLTDAKNPLLARVIVNRLWQHHFGNGLVNTPNDFGFNGGQPTHPELLDWLAVTLQEQKWSLKSLHKSILLSVTYRQAAISRVGAIAVDADNRWLWRKQPLRLEAEAVRDAVLTVAGGLNPRMGGPGYQDFDTYTRNTQFYEATDPVGYEFQRRSLYRTWVRSGRNPLLDVLDCPDPSATAPKRAVTTTPLQALALLNNSFMLRMADMCADRIETLAPGEPEKQVEQLYLHALGRPADSEEVSLGVEFLSEHGLSALCRVLFNSNEFLYVD